MVGALGGEADFPGAEGHRWGSQGFSAEVSKVLHMEESHSHALEKGGPLDDVLQRSLISSKLNLRCQWNTEVKFFIRQTDPQSEVQV